MCSFPTVTMMQHNSMAEEATHGHEHMEMPGHSQHSDIAMHGMQKEMAHPAPKKTMQAYDLLRATHSTRLPDENPLREVVLEVTGNMDRYVWSFNNIALTEADKILIRRGENVRFVLVNKTMMHIVKTIEKKNPS